MKLWAILVVIFIIFIAYGQTLGMYFWQDDSALIFKLQNPQGPAGSYGEGIIGQGPYKYLVTPFVPFFPIFGLNPTGYFLVGLIAYYLSAASFYLFATQLFQSKKAGFVSTLVYAAGYIGSDTMLRISNSWQTNFGLIFALLSFWALVKFLRSPPKFWYYFLSLLLFYGAVEFVFIRSHSLIIPILVLDLLLTVKFWQFRQIPWLILRQIPFWFLFYNRYLSETVGSSGLGLVINNLLQGKVEVLASFFATLGNALIPNVWQLKYVLAHLPKEQLLLLLIFIVLSWLLLRFFSAGFKIKMASVVFFSGLYFLNKLFISKNLFWYRSESDFISGALGLYLPILIIALAITLWKTHKDLALALLFGLAMLASQVFGYFIQYQESIFSTTHRYLTYSFVGYSIIAGGISFVLFEKILKSPFLGRKKGSLFLGSKYAHLWAALPLILLLGNNLYLEVNRQRQVVADISQPTRKFYQDLKKFVPRIEKGAVFYFDIKDDNFYKFQFRNFFSVGSMPESTALAIYYGVDRYDLSLIDNFDELLSKLADKEIKVDSLYSFYYGEQGLINTTEAMRNLVKDGSKAEILSLQPGAASGIPLVGEIKTHPLTPMLLILQTKVIPRTDQIVFPYSQSGQKSSLYLSAQKQQVVDYLLSRQEYYKAVKATSLSQWKYQEIYNIVDDDPVTSWRGHRIYWHEKRHEQVIIDLGAVKKISKVVWTNWNHTLTPISYAIDVSSDKESWIEVKRVVNGLERQDGEVVVEDFDEVVGRYVRMDITATLSNDAPSLSEVEVVASDYDNIDPQKALSFIKSPFDFISTRDELNLLLSKIAPLLELKVSWSTNKGGGERTVLVGSFDNVNTYQLVLNPGGIVMKDLTISAVNAPVKLEVQSVKLENLNLEEIKKWGLIKKFVEN